MNNSWNLNKKYAGNQFWKRKRETLVVNSTEMMSGYLGILWTLML